MMFELKPIGEEKHEIFEVEGLGRVRRVTSSDGVAHWERLEEQNAEHHHLGETIKEWATMEFGDGRLPIQTEGDKLEEAYLKRGAPPVSGLFSRPSGYRQH